MASTKNKPNRPLSFIEAQAILNRKDFNLNDDPEFIASICKSDIVEDMLRAMKEIGINQSDLARKLSKSRQYISQIFKEEANLTIDSLASIAAAFQWQLIMRMIRPDEFMPVMPGTRLEEIRDNASHSFPFQSASNGTNEWSEPTQSGGNRVDIEKVAGCSVVDMADDLRQAIIPKPLIQGA